MNGTNKLLKVSFYIGSNDYVMREKDMKKALDFIKESFRARMYQTHIISSLPIEGETPDYLQNENCDLALLEQHFDIEAKAIEYPFPIIPGMVFRHFKGKTVKIQGLANHTEFPSQRFVVYEDDITGWTWARPLEMFCSRVDKGKYPDVTQEYRFEPIIDQRETKTATGYLMFTDKINNCKNYDFFNAEMGRLCGYYKGRCDQCPLNNLYRGDCLNYLSDMLDRAVKTLQEWSDKTQDRCVTEEEEQEDKA